VIDVRLFRPLSSILLRVGGTILPGATEVAGLGSAAPLAESLAAPNGVESVPVAAARRR